MNLFSFFQAIAIQQCLQLDPCNTLNVPDFINVLIDKMKEIEKDEEG